jgi:hypothetical protein
MNGKTHRIGLSLIEVSKKFGTEKQCLEYFTAARWPEGVRCLRCDGDKLSEFDTNETTRERKNRKGETVTVPVPSRHLYECLNPECGYQFSATTGTLFNDTHLPLVKWFLAVAIMCNARKGVSAKQLERDLGVNYRTAWYVGHRVRKAMEEGNLFGEKMTGKIEMDETYVGGKYDRRLKRERWDKEPVFGMLQRNEEGQPSQVRAYHVPQVNRFNIYGKIKENVIADAELICTDDAHLYKSLGKHVNRHEIVNHSEKEWIRGEVHTQGIENFWSLFKRGVIGSYHKVSIKHLDRYLAEFCFRFNNRRNEELFALTILSLAISAALPYAKLIGKTAEPEASEPEDAPF